MGNIESGEIASIGNIWDNPLDGDREGGYYRDPYRESFYRSPEDDSERTPSRGHTPARTPARTAPPSPAPIAKGKESSGTPPPEEATAPAEPAAAAPIVAAAEEIISEAADVSQAQVPPEDSSTTVTHEVNISKSQKTNQVAPEATTTKPADGATTVVVKESRMRSTLQDMPFAILFVVHLLLVMAGILYLNIMYVRDMTQRKLHNLERWFPQLGAAVLTGAVFAILCQYLFRRYPKVMGQSIQWASFILTFAASIMLISTSIPANLGVGSICLIFSICQGLYACWISSRIKYATDLLEHSLNTVKRVRGTYPISMWMLLVASVWVVFWSFGVVSALSFKLVPLVILALLASLAWTLETLRNVVGTATARGVADIYLANPDLPHWDHSLQSACTSWFGSICAGSLIVPILHVMRVLARGLNRIHGDNEFMFSCANCFYKVTQSFTIFANNWAYVQVAVHRKAFFKASRDTFLLFTSKRLNIVIDKDLTSSFCVLSGISGGMLCVIVSGGWTFGTHKALTSSVSVVSFFIGYFLVRITMAVPQGAVCAHYVCYGENPTSQELLSSPVPDRLKELAATDIDIESAKHV